MRRDLGQAAGNSAARWQTITIWITFSAGYLWWAIAEGPVEFLGGSVEAMEERGSRLRRTRDGWHNTSVGGTTLRIPYLNGALTQTAAYRMTICAVDIAAGLSPQREASVADMGPVMEDDDYIELANRLIVLATAMLEDATELAVAGQSARLNPEQIVDTGRQLQAAALEIAIIAEAATIVAKQSMNQHQNPCKPGR